VGDAVTQVHRLMAIANEAMDAESMALDCCIEASWIGTHALRQLGAKLVYPLAVDVRIYNTPLAAFIREHDREPAADEVPDAWALILDTKGDAPKRYAGHVVTMWRDLPAVIDFSYRQFERPEKGITFPQGLAFHVPEAWPDSGEWMAVQGPGGISVLMRAQPKKRDYRNTPGWRQSPERHTARVQWIVNTAKEAVGAAT
jgi:hypothetical protein